MLVFIEGSPVRPKTTDIYIMYAENLRLLTIITLECFYSHSTKLKAAGPAAAVRVPSFRPGPSAARTAAVRVPAVTRPFGLARPQLSAEGLAAAVSDRRPLNWLVGNRCIPGLGPEMPSLADSEDHRVTVRVCESDAAALGVRLGVDSDSESRRRPSDSEHTPTTPHRARPLQTHSGRLSRRPQSGSGIPMKSNNLIL
jgi:hypothetical protein